MPNSKLFLKYGTYFDDQVLVRYWENKFSQFGISENQLIFCGSSLTRKQHLEEYRNIDIALDPFPFNGATTTFEALAMGVLTISLEGQHFIDRVSASLLSAVELGEFVAHSQQEYINISKDITSDLKSLQNLRLSLRERLSSSSLCQGKRYARSMENAYRDMWRTWCSC